MRILYLSIGMASPLNLSLELSRRLVAAGHEMVYASHADIENIVRDHGHDFVRLRALGSDESTSSRASWRALAERRRARRVSIEDDEPIRLLDEIRPDRVLADIEMHVAILKIAGPAAERGIPLLLTMAFFSVHRAPGRPPLHTPHVPATTLLARLYMQWLWLRLRLETLHFEWRERLARFKSLDLWPPIGYTCFAVGDLRAVARAHAFPLRRETSRSQWLRPFMYTRLPVLCLNHHALDWPSEPPGNVHYVGAMVMTEPPAGRREVATGLDESTRARLEAFLDADADQPLVYASLGSFWSADLDLLRAIICVFERRREWRLVLGLGGQLEPSALGSLPGRFPEAKRRMPGNVLALGWAPQVELLTRADAAIVHGGVATLNECARLGVPMLVYSTGFVEQDGNAARIGHHGLGLVAEKTPDIGISKHIESLLGRLLDDDAMRERLQAVQRELMAEEERGVAVRLVEEAVANAGEVSTP